jgi:hypothetical protein
LFHHLALIGSRDMNETSALASVRALRDQILARLEQNEDFRVLRGLEIVLARESRPPQGQQVPQGQAVGPGARAVQEGLAALMATPPYWSGGLSGHDELLPFGKVQAEAKPADSEEEKHSAWPERTTTKETLVRELRRLAGT